MLNRVKESPFADRVKSLVPATKAAKLPEEAVRAIGQEVYDMVMEDSAKNKSKEVEDLTKQVAELSKKLDALLEQQQKTEVQAAVRVGQAVEASLSEKWQAGLDELKTAFLQGIEQSRKDFDGRLEALQHEFADRLQETVKRADAERRKDAVETKHLLGAMKDYYEASQRHSTDQVAAVVGKALSLFPKPEPVLPPELLEKLADRQPMQMVLPPELMQALTEARQAPVVNLSPELKLEIPAEAIKLQLPKMQVKVDAPSVTLQVPPSAIQVENKTSLEAQLKMPKRKTTEKKRVNYDDLQRPSEIVTEKTEETEE